jgi:peptidoglycan-associated lipoprotein
MLIHSMFAIFLRIVTFTVLTIALCLSAAAQFAPRAEIALEYNYVHSNAPPSGCGCFSMMGGSASAAFKLHGGLAAVGEFSAAHAGNIAPAGEDLTLTSYLFGPRYTYRADRSLAPFGEVLVGLSHASGSLAPSNSLSGASSNAFAAAIGGGLDYNAGRVIAIRIVQADYLLTTFANQADHHQNNFRLGAGIAFHFGR